MQQIEYLSLFIIFLIAWLVPLILSWLEIGKLPSVILEIIMGVVAGPFLLNLIQPTPILDFLSQTGFLFLIFLAGLEINVPKIISSLPIGKLKMIDVLSNSLILALFIYFGSLIISFPVALFIHLFFKIDIVFFILIFPTVALSITVPILKSEGELNRKFGQILLMEGAIATVMSIIMISIYSGIIHNGFRVELFLFTVIFVVFIIMYVLGKKLIKVRTFQNLLYRLEHAASQIRVRGTVAIAMFFIVIAHLIDTELIMGAFFAGSLLSMFISKQRSALVFKLDSMSYGFFIPIFFIMIGVKLDMDALSDFHESIPFILVVTAGFFITQVVPALIMTKVFGLKKALAGGSLLTARLGLTVATAQIGLSLDIISSAENAGIVAASIITSLISPFLYKLLSDNKDLFHSIYIFGGSNSSLMLAERINMHEIPHLTILQNQAMADQFERKGLKYKLVESISPTILKELNIRPPDFVIALTESKNLNQDLALFSKKELNHSKVITRKQSASKELVALSDDIKLIDHEEVLASYIEDLIVRPEAIESITTSFGEYRIEEIRLLKKDMHRKQVREIAFPTSGSIVMIRRSDEIFIPHGDTHLLIGDVITVIGNQLALSEFRIILE